MAVAIPVKKSIKGHGTVGLTSVPHLNGLEASSQTFKAGAPLVNSSGYLAVGTGPIDTGDAVIGFAARDANNDTAHSVLLYVPALPHVIFEGLLSDSNTSSHTLAQADLLGKYALAVDATTLAWYVDYFNTTNPSAFVFAAIDPIGTVDARVLFIVTDDATIYGV
jgi:hypothetical protein